MDSRNPLSRNIASFLLGLPLTAAAYTLELACRDLLNQHDGFALCIGIVLADPQVLRQVANNVRITDRTKPWWPGDGFMTSAYMDAAFDDYLRNRVRPWAKRECRAAGFPQAIVWAKIDYDPHAATVLGRAEVDCFVTHVQVEQVRKQQAQEARATPPTKKVARRAPSATVKPATAATQ